MNRNTLQSFRQWELKRQLGDGGFGEVHLWRNRGTNEEIATKRLKENNNMSTDEIAKLRQRWNQEYEWMLRWKTPFIVRGVPLEDEEFKAYLNANHAWKELPVIVMEYCNGGDLRTQLLSVENTNGLSEFEVRNVLYALRHAVQYLHEQCHIEHRDLKPDNVVIHHENGKRLYKLADFGLARRTSENTMLKSIVGTRHYVAPEVLATGNYKHTADYWSIGIIAFELICGVLPFIPHQNLFQIVNSIRKKPVNCIAISEDFQHGVDGSEVKLKTHESIFEENSMSKVFLSKIEKWLRIALDVDYKTRGTRAAASSKPTDRLLCFYTELDDILETKVLTVFCITTFSFYTYEVSPEMNLETFVEIVEKDMQIKKDNIYCIHPTGHPRRILSEFYKPIDFFFEEWQDTQKWYNPPVMLYIVGYESNYNVPNPVISDLLKEHLHEKRLLPDWRLRLYEKHTHFLLSNEQRHLKAYVCGLKEYAMSIEQEIFNFDKVTNKIRTLFNEISEVRGRVDQFASHIESAKIACIFQQYEIRAAYFEKWTNVAARYKEKLEGASKIVRQVETRYNSALRRAKEEATNKIFDELKDADLYGLMAFRTHLEGITGNKISNQFRLENCQNVIYDCINKRKSLVSNPRLNKSRDTITSVHCEFNVIKNLVEKTENFLLENKSHLQRDTVCFESSLIDLFSNIASNQNNLITDDTSRAASCSNNVDDSIQEMFGIPTDALIDNLQIQLNQLNLQLKECRKLNEIPTTIDDQ